MGTSSTPDTRRRPHQASIERLAAIDLGTAFFDFKPPTGGAASGKKTK
jgi:hypothetical protein